MIFEDIEEKLLVIRRAEDCMHSVVSVNPSADLHETFVILNRLKIDLIDMMDEREGLA